MSFFPNRRVCSVLATHNRKEKTLACLRSLYASASNAPLVHQVVLVDDASKDGTADAVSKEFPEIEIVSGSGDLFWNQAMRMGIDVAMESDPDFIMLLNDDAVLDPSSLTSLLETLADIDERNTILVASLRDPDTGEISYGGLLRSSAFHPLRFKELVIPDEKSVKPCDTFNANCVLVPTAVIRRIGNLATGFVHSKGDYDYGLRARAAGVELLVAPGTYGICKRDGSPYYLPRYENIFRDIHDCATNPKRMPLGELIAFYRQHIKWLWWIYIPLPYARLLANHILSRRNNRI